MNRHQGARRLDSPPSPIRGTHISVWGHSGSGKSTVARQLGARLGLPVAELDALFHINPNWVDASREEFRANAIAFMDANPDGWVIEGNYHALVGDLVRARTETVVWLRLPFRVVYPRLAWRTLSRSLTHAELWGGNRESLKQTFLSKDSMLLWGITQWRATPRKSEAAKLLLPRGTRLITLRSARSVRRLLDAATPPPTNL